MIEYENSALELVTGLKNKHEEEMEFFVDKNREELALKVHFSKYVIEKMTT